MLIPVGTAPLALADPPPDPAVPAAPGAPGAPAPDGDDGPPPDTGVVASADPGVVTSPDGWTLTVVATNESQLPVAPLTTATSSREYLVGGTFTGTVTGGGKTSLNGGVLEAGYQIGCGIELGQVRLIGQVGATLNFGTVTGLVPTGVNFPISGTIEIHPKPGTVSTVTVDKKSFKGTATRITITGVRVKTDQCAGQSFIRSYATLTSSTDNTDDVITYLGVTKAV